MSDTMYGDDVKRIRADYGLSALELAQLLGVHPSTVYRWEGCEWEDAKIDGAALRLLQVIEDAWPTVPPGQVSADIRVGGGLYAMYRILGVFFGQPSTTDGRDREAVQ